MFLDVMNYQRINDNKIILELHSFPLNSFLNQVAEFSKTLIPSDSKITFSSKFAGNLPEFIIGDKHRIRQVLQKKCLFFLFSHVNLLFSSCLPVFLLTISGDY